MRLPVPTDLAMTGPTDPILYHYRPVIRYFMNRRLEMALALLGTRRYRRLLDAGVGGGVFLPELAQRTDELHGIDIHPRLDGVKRLAEREHVPVQLRRASITATGYPDGFFDCVVSVSVLEFVDDVTGAMHELHRITAVGGTIVLGLPGENVFTNIGYRLARTPDPRRVHRANFRTILARARERLELRRLLRFPRFLPHALTLFFAAELERC